MQCLKRPSVFVVSYRSTLCTPIFADCFPVTQMVFAHIHYNRYFGRSACGGVPAACRYSALARSRPCARRICGGALYGIFLPRLQRQDTFDLCKGLQEIEAGRGAIRRRKASRVYKNEIPRAFLRVVFLHVLFYARYSPVSSLRTRSALFSAIRAVHVSLVGRFCSRSVNFAEYAMKMR